MAYSKRKKSFHFKKRVCLFCDKLATHIDYKDVETISKFISPTGQIKSKSNTGTCAKHQRKLSTAIKRARLVALLPFTVARVRINKTSN